MLTGAMKPRHEAFPYVETKDRVIKNEAEAEANMRATLNKLMDMHEKYNLPCVFRVIALQNLLLYEYFTD